jgi:RNA polymerase sigma-70 factor (sigma-E family)
VTTPDQDFVCFVASRQAALRRAAWLLTGDEDLAEDLVQTALIKVWPRWAKISAAGAADAYVRRVLVTTYFSWWRRKWRSEVPGAVPELAGVDQTDAVDLSHAVRAALLSLPRRQRVAVVLRYYEDLSEQQTAVALGCSVGTVKSQTSRALARLRTYPGLTDILIEGADR